jgi:superfamily II DNA or RNA helicase
MVKVYIKPSSIWIYPYKLHQCYKLEKTLAIYDIYKKHYTAFLYEFDKEDDTYGILKVPRGIGIDMVKQCLNSQDLSEGNSSYFHDPLEYEIIDDTMVYAFPRKIHFEMRVPPKNEEQIRSIEFLNTTCDRQKMLCLDVGRGKTYCATHFIRDTGVAAMILSYNLSEQWLTKISEYTDCVNGKDIILIVGSSFLEECIKNPKKYNAKIYICSLTTLFSFAQMHGKAALQKIVDSLGIGIKIFDEAHMRYLQFNMVDLNMQVAQTIYLTATPGRSNAQEKRMFSKIYSQVKTHGNTIEGYNNHYTIRFINYDSKTPYNLRQHFKNVRGLKSTSYSRYLFDTHPTFVHDLVKSFMKEIFEDDKNAKILLLIDWLQDMFTVRDQFRKDEYVKKEGLTVGTYCQLVKNPKEKENQLQCNIIIGSIGSMQNGKDINNLRAIFPFTQFSSEIVTHQLLGRLRPIKGKEVIYYDIADYSVPDILKQRMFRKKVFQTRSVHEIAEYTIANMDNIEESFEKPKQDFFRSVVIR